jgi:membrane-associated protease RseP (regulator of RpoE activity)
MTREQKTILTQALLFLATFLTTTLAGAELCFGKSILSGNFSWNDFLLGMNYSVPFLFILSVHEFGHYFTARYHHVRSSLPYYIPFYLPIIFPFSIGTFGALIRLREHVPSLKKNFDIGIAGPLAGMVAALMVLVYGFISLPDPDYIFSIHPEYLKFGSKFADHVYEPDFLKGGFDIVLGDNLLFNFLSRVIADPLKMPNPHEIIHYPFLLAGYLSLVFTALNLMPIGQLDGGHVIYGLFGSKGHRIIAMTIFILFVFFAGLGTIHPGIPTDELMFSLPLYVGFLFFTLKGLKFHWQNTLIITLIIFIAQYLTVYFIPSTVGFGSWLLFAFLLGRFMGIYHPPAIIEEPLSVGRKILGWVAMVILVLCFTPVPIEINAYLP